MFRISLALLLLVCPAAVRAAGTTTTTYSYNADGALTAVATQSDSGDTSTLYLRWDNFTPDADDPTTGTVSSADGNLTAIGATPGEASASLRFDRRDRLVGYRNGSLDLSYEYHPDGTLASSSTANGDGLLLYYDGTASPRVTNLRQSPAGLWSARLGDLRHLSDGTEQALLLHRKDVAADYEPAAQALTPYRYDAYGAETSASASTSYDVHDNPWRYAGELRDALWQGIYLGARWYSPQLPSFASRDPLAHLNRYGYGDGNPVMNVDPSGRRASLFGVLDEDLGKLVTTLDGGVPGHFMRILFSPVLDPLAMLAHPQQFWSPTKFPFLIAGLLAPSAFEALELSASAIKATSTAIDLSGAVAAGFGGHRHFDAGAFVASLERAFEPTSLFAKEEGFEEDLEDPEESIGRARKNAIGREEDALLARSREGGAADAADPRAETGKLGAFHKRLVIAATADVAITGIAESVAGSAASRTRGLSAAGGDRQETRPEPVASLLDQEAQLQPARHHIGKPQLFEEDLAARTQASPELAPSRTSHGTFHQLFDGCRRHEAAIIGMLRQRG